LPDGNYVTVPTDDPKQAAAMARQFWANNGNKSPDTSKPKSLWSRYKSFADKAGDFVGDFAGNAVDQVLPNWMDELYAAPRAAKALVTGQDAGKAFTDAQRRYKANQKAFAKDHPTAKTASTVTGVLGGLYVPAGKALKGASLGRKAIQGAGVGALYGTIGGAGEGEGADVGRRTVNALGGAGAGALTGAAIPVGLSAGLKAGRAVRSRVPIVDKTVRWAGDKARSLNDMVPPDVRRPWASAAERRAEPNATEMRAYGDLVDTMGQGHLDAGPGLPGAAASPGAVASEVGRRNALGAPAMVGDVSTNLRGLTARTSRSSGEMGPGQRLVREALEDRKTTEGGRVAGYIRDNLPTVADPVQYLDDYTRQAKAAAGPLYAEAYSQPVYRTPDIQAIERTPAFRDALPQAFRNIRNQLDDVTGQPKDPYAMGFRAIDGDPQGLPPNLPFFRLPDGQVVAVDNGLSAEGYDQVIRAMRDQSMAVAGRDPVTGRVLHNTDSVHIGSLAGRLRDNLAEQNQPYAQAVRGYGDAMAHTNAFRQGQDIANLSGPEIAAQTRALPDAAYEPWATGAGTAIAADASKYAARHPYGDVAGRVSALLGDDAKQAALSEVTGNTGGIRNLQDLLEAERQASLNWRGAGGVPRATGNSDALSDPSTDGRGMFRKGLEWVADKANARSREDYDLAMAEALTSRDPETVDSIARTVRERAARDQAFRDRLQRKTVRGVGLYGRSIAPLDPVVDEEDQYDWAF
jgi:hypothetical protein